METIYTQFFVINGFISNQYSYENILSKFQSKFLKWATAEDYITESEIDYAYLNIN